MAQTLGQEKKEELLNSGTAPKMSPVQGGRNNKEESKESSTADFMQKGQEIVRGFAGKAKDISHEAKEKATQYAMDAKEGATSFVRKYPLQSLLAGFGIGCLVGVLFTRTRD